MRQRTTFAAVILFVVTSLGLYGQAKPDATKLISALSGTWKEDQSKRQLGSGLDLRFRTATGGGLEELRGPELRPMVQPVKFDGKPYAMDSGNSLTWKQLGTTEFERTTALNGKQLSSRRIRISADGKTLSEEMKRMSLDGQSSTRTAEYRRTSGQGAGLVGTWQLAKATDSEPAEFKYEPAGPNSVKLTNRLGQNYVLTFDGKEAPVTGSGVIPGMTMSVVSSTATGMETLSSREGTKVAKSRVELSEGGKVMTVTTTSLASADRKPGVVVFRKQ